MRYASIAAISLAALAACTLYGSSDDATPPPASDDAGPDAALTDSPSTDSTDIDACSGPCGCGPCAPELLATVPGGDDIRLFADRLYIRYAANDGVRKIVSVAASTPSAPATEFAPATIPDTVQGYEITADGIFVGTPNGIVRVNAQTAAPFYETSMVNGLNVVGGDLYWALNAPTGYIAHCTIPSCTNFAYARTGISAPLDLMLVNNYLVWFAGPDAPLRLQDSVGTLSDAAGELAPTRLVTDGTDVFWSTNDGVKRLTVATRTISVVVPSAGAITRATVPSIVGATAFYGRQKSIERCPKLGGAAITVTTTDATVAAVVADATWVYWVDGTRVQRMRHDP